MPEVSHPSMPTDSGSRGENIRDSERMSRREIVAATNRVLVHYGVDSLARLRPIVRAGGSREDMGYVRNRPGEVQHAIDLYGEGLLASVIRSEGLPSLVIGENNTNTPLGGNLEPLVVFPIDPLDNTSPYVRGLDILPYSVVGAYDRRGGAIGGVQVDIAGNKIYTATTTKVTVKDMETGEVKELTRSNRKDISDEKITIASFVGEYEYSGPFFDNFRPLLERMHKKGMLYPGGGAFIYALLASGAIDAYIMLDEPRSEIDPGLPFLLAAGGKAESIDLETGKGTPYKFDPELTVSESVPLFIAYSQPEIRDVIVESYLQGRHRFAEQQEALQNYRQLRAGQAVSLHPSSPDTN